MWLNISPRENETLGTIIIEADNACLYLFRAQYDSLICGHDAELSNQDQRHGTVV